jgi:hypothetical protein
MCGTNADMWREVVKVTVWITIAVTSQLGYSHGILYMGVKWADEAIQPLFGHVAAFRRESHVSTLGISGPYATDIRAGGRRPHQRHWEKLARLVGVSTTDS